MSEIFTRILIPELCRTELEKHGWGQVVRSAAPRLSVLELTAGEKEQALSIARKIAGHSASKDREAGSHLGESQAVVLALRPEHRDDILLLDEFAARKIALGSELKLSGFPGVLLLAARGGLISAEDLKSRLETCRAKGTHYGKSFIEQVYDMAKNEQR
ncbi:MAG: hypothetical protein GY722_27100 [bacterium]|nr:hypothetical protein [bacterium]